MPLKIVRNDICKMAVDVIVNTANPEPIYAGGVDCAIYEAAGKEKLLKVRKKIGRIQPGNVALTRAYNLNAKYIIHAVGPGEVDWQDDSHRELEQLRSCYIKSLNIAIMKRCRSIAFPVMGTGNNGLPEDKGIALAIEAINSIIINHDIKVYLVVFGQPSLSISKMLFPNIDEFINDEEVKSLSEHEYEIDNVYQGRGMRKSSSVSHPILGGVFPKGRHSKIIEQSEIEGSKVQSEKQTADETFDFELDELIYVDDEFDFEMDEPIYVGDEFDFDSDKQIYTDDEMMGDEWDSESDGENDTDAGHNVLPLGKATLSKDDAATCYGAPMYMPAAEKYDNRKGFNNQEANEQEFDEDEFYRNLEKVKFEVNETFQQMLMRHILQKRYKHSEVYRRANMTKQTFFKIKKNVNYHPTKETAFALALALRLNLDETIDFIARASYAFSSGSRQDAIVKFCILNECYDIAIVDAVLDEYGEKTLTYEPK